MVSESMNVVTGHRMSTVTTASVTGGAVHELSGVDLAMKLHYLRVVYYFRRSEAVDGCTTPALKDPMFPTLDRFSPAAGRIRRRGDGGGRPHVKCNDGGVRVVEAVCPQTVEEWLEAEGGDRRDGQLVPDKVLGPDLGFSPLLFLQFTRFKGGGLAVGVSWAHVLGDAVSASNCINLWGRLLAGRPAVHRSPSPKNPSVSPATGRAEGPVSVKQVETEGDMWLPRTQHRMVTSSFRIASAEVEHLRAKVSGQSRIPAFEAISGLIWKSVAEIRAGKEPKVVTVIRNDCSEERSHQVLSNGQMISTVAVPDSSSLAKVEVSELAMLIRESTGKDEKEAIEGKVDRENGTGDYIVYGANLTFVDMGGAGLYGFDIKGQKPVRVECSVGGVGDEGAVLVLPEPGGGGGEEAGDSDGGKVTVTVIMPEHEMPELKLLLGREWGVFA